MVQQHALSTTGQPVDGVVDQPASDIAPDQPVVVDVSGVTKSYGGVHALRGVDFSLRAGEVHALLGQNGAGKSTLIKILAGVTPPSQGRIEVLGQEVSFSSPHDSLKAGIGVVYQDLSLVPSMTVLDNLYLGREPMRFGTVDRRAMMEEAQTFLERYDFPLNLRARVGDIPFAYRQMTEIAKALMGERTRSHPGRADLRLVGVGGGGAVQRGRPSRQAGRRGYPRHPR